MGAVGTLMFDPAFWPPIGGLFYAPFQELPVDPLDRRWITYQSPDGSMERTMTKQLADLLYPDWIEVSAIEHADDERRELPPNKENE